MAQDTNGQEEDQYQIPCHGIGKRQDDFGASVVEAIQSKDKLEHRKNRYRLDTHGKHFQQNVYMKCRTGKNRGHQTPTQT